MKSVTSARWLVLRRLYEVHGISLAELALVSARAETTIKRRARKEGWSAEGEETYAAKNTLHLAGQLADVVRHQLDALNQGGEITAAAEKQIRMLTSLIGSLNKARQMSLQADPADNDIKNGKMHEARNAGEDILALRADLEAFIEQIGEEPADPCLSGGLE